jgi:heme A synthase
MITMLHSGWAYITVLILIIAVGNAIIGLTSNKEFTDKDLRIPLFALIVAHIQLLIGLVAYFSSAQFALLKEHGMGAAMKDPEIRLAVMEHPLVMIIAVVLITVGFSKHKNKTSDKAKFKTIALYYGVALLFILSRIPWAQWFN